MNAEWASEEMAGVDLGDARLDKRAATLLSTLGNRVASLGGYIERRNSEPGPQTVWIGMQRMYDLAWAWDTFGPGAKIGDG